MAVEDDYGEVEVGDYDAWLDELDAAVENFVEDVVEGDYE